MNVAVERRAGRARLIAAAFARLLDRLGPDPKRAGAAYEELAPRRHTPRSDGFRP